MTGQVGEFIIIDGVKKSMPWGPDLPASDPRIIKVGKYLMSTACWRGYVATWEIADGKLYLKSIEGNYEIKDDQPLFANWVTETLTIPSGDVLVRGDGLSSTIFEYEENIEINKGMVGATEIIDNRPEYSVYKDLEYITDIPLCGSVEEFESRIRQCESAATEKIAKHRGITSVFHFTKSVNLPSILEYGLIGRKDLLTQGISAEINDEYRHDGAPDAICASISFPNYRMLYFLRQKYPEHDWAILRLDARLLWELPCAFCASNAASSEVRERSLDQRQAFLAINDLFSDIPGKAKRKELNIPDSYTTDPQAEVLILESVSTDYILDINFDSPERIKNFPEVKRLMSPYKKHFTFLHDATLFSYRRDYKFWTTEKTSDGNDKGFVVPDF